MKDRFNSYVRIMNSHFRNPFEWRVLLDYTRPTGSKLPMIRYHIWGESIKYLCILLHSEVYFAKCVCWFFQRRCSKKKNTLKFLGQKQYQYLKSNYISPIRKAMLLLIMLSKNKFNFLKRVEIKNIVIILILIRTAETNDKVKR